MDLNPEFSFLEMGKTERLEGTNSYGEDWFGYLVKPLDFVQASRYPLIVTTYRSGDYFLRGASGDENPIQVYAAHGFAVLSFDVGWLRNPAGGDFDAKLLDWASPVASIEDAVERLTKEGIVDPARVGIAGYSHGEEIAGYAVTHTHLFQAAVRGRQATIRAFIFWEVTSGTRFSKSGDSGDGPRASLAKIGAELPCPQTPTRL